MLFKTYVISSILALTLFGYAQAHGWSVWGVNESKAEPGSTRTGYHK